ncbi:MAG: tRNA (N6-isopentenyl adenosine(37)-C2)-methylthiotransferase MiaB, partial [Nitrospirae bacterium]|nr:tRNA (N6-isopentenyl adenosine(37)-C2)-methylthiotransferase MiaB [Nitrospirota bacterium]
MDPAPPLPLEDTPRVYLETYGCQMNVYDSELVASILREGGFVTAATLDSADVALLNTCAIRESAQEKVWQRLQALARLKTEGRLRAIGLLGCMAQSLRR